MHALGTENGTQAEHGRRDPRNPPARLTYLYMKAILERTSHTLRAQRPAARRPLASLRRRDATYDYLHLSWGQRTLYL